MFGNPGAGCYLFVAAGERSKGETLHIRIPRTTVMVSPLSEMILVSNHHIRYSIALASSDIHLRILCTTDSFPV